jgi:hypothetical protein
MKAYVPAEQVVTREVLDDPERAAEFNGVIQEFADFHNLDHKIAETFNVDSVPLHYVSLPREDERYADDALYGRQMAIGKFAYSWEQTYVTRNFLPAIEGLPDLRATRAARSVAKQILASVCVWRDIDSISLIKEVEETRDYGLSRSDLLFTNLARLQFNYAHESPTVWEEDELTVDDIPHEDLLELFGQGNVPQKVTFQALADQVRSVQDVDLSRETLDARLYNFLGHAQLEMTNTVLEDLAQFAQTGGDRTRKAMSLAEQFKEDFLADNITRKQEIVLETAAMFSATVPGIKNSPLRRLLYGMSGRLRNVATNLDEFMMFFANAYHSLGYEAPAVLFEVANEPETPLRQLGNTALGRKARHAGRTPKRDRPTGPPVREIITVALPPAEAEKPEPAPVVAEAPVVVDPAVIREIGNRTNTIKAHAGGFEAWRMGTKTRKSLGFDPMQRQLSEGFRDVLGRQLLSPLLKDQAQELIDVMARIDTLAQKREPEAVREQIAMAIERRSELYVAEHDLREYAKLHGYDERIDLPTLVDIERHTGFIAREWPSFRQMIIDTWPKYQGARVAERIGKVLAPPATPDANS